MNWTIRRQGILGCSLAAALAVACADENRSASDVDRDTDRLAQSEAAAPGGREGAPVTLTGCLQKEEGLGGEFVLTQVNRPSDAPVATSGDPARGEVEREQIREAKRAYQLSGETDDLEPLVGKQVRIAGRIAETSDLQPSRESDRSDREIDADDLAEVNVESIERVADTCS
jgi:hypothetical protein